MRKTLLFPLILFFSFSAFAGTTIIDSIYTGGVYRNYRIYVPSAYTGATAWPLIYNIHGYTSNAAAQQLYTNFDVIADTAHFLMVYPNATIYMGQPTWNSGFGMTVDDVGFLSVLIDSLDLTYNIDLDRVYSCGMSNGGFMSHTLACALSNRVAAIASVTGSMTTYQQSTCSPTHPMPVMQIHGTADGTVPYGGSSGVMNIDTLVKYWYAGDHCNPVPAYNAVPDINTSDGATADHYVWSGGDNGSTVELYKINGGGHTWPGMYPIGVTCEDFNASEKIWLFFRKYKLSQLLSVNDLTEENSFELYPNPSENTVTVNGKNISSIRIFDMNGRLVKESREKALDVSALTKGVYSVVVFSGGKSSVKKFVKI
ncbi:MAG: T9SS type A sorting domain-containing protein [Bacteroidia bacterium]